MDRLTVVLLFIATAHSIEAEFLGCYEDSSIRLLPDFQIIQHNVNSPANCKHICLKLQYQYAGVEGSECFCSIERPNEKMRRDTAECNMKCPYSEEICGGSSRISVHSVDSTVFPTTDHGIYIGCYKDKPSRILNDFRIILRDTNSPQRCLHLCTVLGYLYGGTEGINGDLCFCGNEIPPYEMKAGESECQAKCPNSQEKCGGNWRIAIFRTSVDPNADSITTVSDQRLSRNAIGCFEDSNPRTLSNVFIDNIDGNSPKRCLYICQQLGYQYAGVQSFNECYCGNNRPSESEKRDDAECKKFLCPNSNEYCGGPWRNYVYSTQKNPKIVFQEH